MSNRSNDHPHEWQKALWIWHETYPEGEAYASGWFRHRFSLDAPRSGWLYVAAKGGFVLHLNGSEIAREESSANYQYVLDELLRPGTNVIAIFAECERDTPTGLLVIGSVQERDGSRRVMHTDATWRVAKAEPGPHWLEADFDDGAWPRASSVEEYLRSQDWVDGQMPLVDPEDLSQSRRIDTAARSDFAGLMGGLDSARFDGFIDRYCPSQSALEAERIPIYTGGGMFPVICKLDNGDVLAAVRGGASHVGIRGRVDVVRSSDGGQSWSAPVKAVDSDADERNPAIGQMADGTVVLACMSAAYDLKDTYRAARCSVKITRSADGGRTWHDPAALDLEPLTRGSPFAKIILLPDSTALLPIYTRIDGESVCCASWSRDHGRTWSAPEVLYKGTGETALLCFPDGELLALGRPAGGWLIVRRSADQGRTWSEPVLFSQEKLPIHPGDLILLRDGRVLATYGHRIFPYGCRARISDDRGETWSRQFVLVDDSMNWDCGYPSSVELDDGRILTAHYATLSRRGPELGVHCMGIVWKMDG